MTPSMAMRTRIGVAVVGGALLAACGATPPAAQTAKASSGEAPLVDARDVGKVDPTNCNTVGFVAAAGAGCKEVRSKNASGGAQHVQAATANDGDACTVWNSGGVPPQAITVDLERDVPVSGLLLVPDMTPPEGDVTHVIEQSRDGDVWLPVVVVQKHMVDDHVYAVSFPQKITTRFLRVATSASVSWVAWAEVAPLLCGG